MNPIPPPLYYNSISLAYRIDRQYEKAIGWAEKSLQHNSEQILAYLTLAASYSSLNRIEKTRLAANEVMKREPNFSTENLLMTLPYKNQVTADRYKEALYKAGLPE